MEIKLTPEESEKIFFDALCNVYGSGYWNGYGLEINVTPKAYKEALRDLQQELRSEICKEDVFMQVLRDGRKLFCIDYQYDHEYDKAITLSDIHERVSKAPAEHVLDAIKEEGDVVTSDVILQQVFFQEIVFG